MSARRREKPRQASPVASRTSVAGSGAAFDVNSVTMPSSSGKQAGLPMETQRLTTPKDAGSRKTR